MKTFRVSFTCLEGQLGTALYTLTNVIDNIRFDIEGGDVLPSIKQKQKRKTNGHKAVAETRVGTAVLKILEGRKKPVTAKEVGRILGLKGFSRSSASPALSQLAKAGKVKCDTTNKRRYFYTLA